MDDTKRETIADAGIDWLTVTAPMKNLERFRFEDVYNALRTTDALEGAEEKKARILGYIGSQIGGMFLGGAKQGWMMRFSSALASEALTTFKYLGVKPHVTRIDCQVTVALDWDDAGRAADAAAEVKLWQEESGPNKRPRITHIAGFGRGDTVIVGARSSPVYFRLYDKSRERSQVGPPWLWRYEVELKQDHAEKATSFLLENADPRQASIHVVETYAASRGIRIPWPVGKTYILPKVPRQESEDERSLRWLRSVAAPVCHRLIKHNRTSDVIEACGLVDFLGGEDYTLG